MMRCDMLLSANQRPGWASFEIRLIPGLTSGDIYQ
ncbi:Uncharacterised protein [Klebsiella pneumoniae]|uniref:Uncharacterized protein n=1 Tax=Klebsiella pneumoniae TaxID=573 RepID=A0A8B4VS93_KLEPN|nr:Uncharacterised protein [Klebsiella pneumoniae]